MTQKLTAGYNDPQYDYRAYWKGRQYEDRSERIALQKLLHLVPDRNRLIDIGAGYGRLTNEYLNLFSQCLLVEPSARMARQLEKLKSRSPNLQVKAGVVEKLPTESNLFDLALLIRTFHHLKEPQLAIREIGRVLKPKGFFILEFPNKIHFKRCLQSILKLDFPFLNLDKEDISTKEGITPFFNYHPQQVINMLSICGFKVIKILTVSNFRHPILKKLRPLTILLKIESAFSDTASRLPVLKYFGPSIFILAQKH